jgi:uncharacterized RDD family membrane protein YckC
MYTTYAGRGDAYPGRMSDSGTPPPDFNANPYGGAPPPPQQPPYQQPAAQPGPYGQPSGQPQAYGQPYGQPAAPPPPGGYAHWGKRVGSYLLDSLFTGLTAIPAYGLLIAGIAIGSKDMETYTDVNGVSRTTGDWNSGGTPLVVIGCVLMLVPIAFFVWNTCLRQGRTGYSLGKGIVGIRLVKDHTGEPIGGGMSFVRQLCHVLDSFCYIGYLWPLWDPKRQTFADKILSTIVVNQPK